MTIFKKISFLIFLISSFCSFANTRTLRSFGAIGNGITDDSVVIHNAILACQYGDILDGEGCVYLLEKTVKLTLKELKLINCKFILGKSYNRQGNFRITSNHVSLTNISVDGGRSGYVKDVEKWNVFTTENNVESISPDRPDFFYFYAMDKSAEIKLKGFRVKNLHAYSALTIYTLGKVSLKDLDFENLSYKTFHVYHSIDNGANYGGQTIVTNAYANNIGIFPPKLQINGKVYTRDKVKMMPQGAFNFIVSFGDYIAHNLKVLNYGSTAVTADRNENFIGDSIVIENNTKLAFSNNPSGGMWFENCGNATIKNIKIKIISRDKRDLNFDSSAMHIFSINGKVTIDDLNIDSGKIASLNKGLRGSFLGKCDVLIKKFTLSGNYKTSPAQFSLLENSVLSTIKIDILNLESKFVEFYGMQKVTIGNVIGKNGDEHLNFMLPTPSSKNDIIYEIKKSNIKEIYVDKNVKNIRLSDIKHKPLIKILN